MADTVFIVVVSSVKSTLSLLFCGRFWEACQQLKYARQADVQNTVQDIYTYDSLAYYHALLMIIVVL